MNVLLKGREVSFYLRDSGAKHLFAWHDFAAAADEGALEADAEVIGVAPGEFEAALGDAPELSRRRVERDGSDTAVLLYTRARPGRPRAPSSRTRTCAATPR